MSVTKQISDFLFFIMLGVVISCIFDIFRALRKIRKKNSIYVVMIQDVIFFIIVTIITVIYMVNMIDSQIRAYMFFAMIVGIALSRKVISKYLIKIYSIFFYSVKNIVIFLCVPMELILTIICKIIKKLAKICCNFFSIMINLKCKLLTVLTKDKCKSIKRGWINGSKSKNKGKKKSK